MLGHIYELLCSYVHSHLCLKTPSKDSVFFYKLILARCKMCIAYIPKSQPYMLYDASLKFPTVHSIFLYLLLCFIFFSLGILNISKTCTILIYNFTCFNILTFLFNYFYFKRSFTELYFCQI